MTKKQRIKLINLWGGGRVDAEKAYAALETLRRSGRLTADRVVDAAADESSPLHGAFDWDDATASGKWRLHQARLLIRAVIVVDDDGKGPPRRVYVRVPPRPGEGEASAQGSYERTEIVAKHVDMFAAALAEAYASLNQAQARIDDLRRYATGDEDRMAILSVAVQALATAEAAIGRLN